MPDALLCVHRNGDNNKYSSTTKSNKHHFAYFSLLFCEKKMFSGFFLLFVPTVLIKFFLCFYLLNMHLFAFNTFITAHSRHSDA